MKKRLTSH